MNGWEAVVKSMSSDVAKPINVSSIEIYFNDYLVLYMSIINSLHESFAFLFFCTMLGISAVYIILDIFFIPKILTKTTLQLLHLYNIYILGKFTCHTYLIYGFSHDITKN